MLTSLLEEMIALKLKLSKQSAEIRGSFLLRHLMPKQVKSLSSLCQG
jgi:hypothetical protein